MKVLILYATKTGTTEKCAGLLADRLLGTNGIQSDVFPVTRAPASFSEYSAVIIGGSIRMGRINKTATELLKKRGSEIMRTKTAYFCCCGFPENGAQYLEDNFGHELCSKAICTGCFGGELDEKKLKGLDKLVAKAVTSKPEQPPIAINEAAINEFADKLSGDLLHRS